jgi:hypothetical protein
MDFVMQSFAQADFEGADVASDQLLLAGAINAVPIPANQNELGPLLVRRTAVRGPLAMLTVGLLINAAWIGGMVWLAVRTALH